MEFLLIGVAVAFNALVIKAKLERGRFADGLLDAALLVGISILFGGSYAGLVVATVASAIISTILFFSPPRLTFLKGLL